MLYSHMRFFIAGVEMPVSGPIYVSGGGLTANLVYVLDSYDDELKKQLRGASPLARSRFENIPVLLAGSKPKTTIDDVDKMMLNTNSDESNYTVLFDGAASMQIAYNPDTFRLDISLSAVPGAVAALNSIVYNNLTVGSYTGSVETAADATVQKAAQEAVGNKTVTTGAGTPNTLNSTMFIKKVVTGKNTQEIQRPTDIIEYAIANILRYAGASSVNSAGGYPLYSESQTFIVNKDESRPSSSIEDAGDDLPSYVKKLWGTSTASTDSGTADIKMYYDKHDYNYLLPDYILRKSLGVELFKASLTPDTPDKWKPTRSLGTLTYLAKDRSSKYIEQNNLWVGEAWPFQYFFKSAGSSPKSPAPKVVTSSFVEASAALKSRDDGVISKFKVIIEASIYADANGAKDEEYEVYLRQNNINEYDIQTFWEHYNPEFVAMINGYVQSYLAVLGMGVIRPDVQDETANILDLLYMESDNSNKHINDLSLRVKDVVRSEILGFYEDMLTDFYQSMERVLRNTIDFNTFKSLVEANGTTFSAREKYGKSYFTVLQPSSKDWTNGMLNGNLKISEYAAMQNLLLPNADWHLKNSYWSDIPNGAKLASAWIDCAHNAVMFGINKGLSTLRKIKGLYSGTALSYSFIKNFYSGSFKGNGGTKALSFISSINSLLKETDKVLSELNPDSAPVSEPSDPSLFDITAAKKILDYAVQNKVGSIGYMRLGKNNNGEGFVYPNLKLSALAEFHQLISNVSSADGNGNVTLYSLINQLYHNLRLGLFMPLNKPYARQLEKQGSDIPELKAAGKSDAGKSVLELLILPVTETCAIPKCNVFCVDRSKPEVAVYDQTKNVTTVLIRYTPPLTTITGTDTAGSVPASYYQFNIQEPEKIYQIVDPKKAFADTKYYDQEQKSIGFFQVGYKSGHIYDLYNTTTVDVSEEVAALAKLCCKPKSTVKADTEAADQALDVQPSTLKFGIHEINTILEENKTQLKPNLKINVIIGAKNPDSSGFVYSGFRVGSNCTYSVPYKAGTALVRGRVGSLPERSSAKTKEPVRRDDNFQAIYEAACYQVVLHYIHKHFAEIKDVGAKSGYRSELETFISDHLFGDFNPDADSPLYDNFKKTAAEFTYYYLFSKFNEIGSADMMPKLKYYDNKWKFITFGDNSDYYTDEVSYPENHMSGFVGNLISPTYELPAQKLLASSLWREAMNAARSNPTQVDWTSPVIISKMVSSKGLWTVGEVKWLSDDKKPYETVSFDKIFQVGDYFIKSLGPAYRASSLSKDQKKADDFASAMEGGTLNIYFPETPEEDNINRFRDILVPIRKNVLYGAYRTALQFYCCDFAMVKCLKQRYTLETPNKTDYPIDVLNNIVKLSYGGSDNEFDVALSRLTTTEALSLTGNMNVKLTDTVFKDRVDDKGAEGNVIVDGLTITGEEDLKALLSETYYGKLTGAARAQANKTEYVWSRKKRLRVPGASINPEIDDSDSPYWSYLVYGSAFVSVSPENNKSDIENSNNFHRLVTPYFFTKKVSSENNDALPDFSDSIRFDSTTDKDVSEILKVVERNDATNVNTYSKNDYKGKEYYVLLPMGGKKPKTSRAKFNNNENSISVPIWPFIVYYDCGRKASVIYYDMYSGGSSNLTSIETLIQSDAFGRKHYYFNLDGTPDDWVESNKDLQKLRKYIQEHNFINQSSSVFNAVKDDASAYVIYPFPMDESLDYLRMALNIPMNILSYELKRTKVYDKVLKVLDPRAEVGKAMSDWIKRINDADKERTAFKDGTSVNKGSASASGLASGTVFNSPTDRAFSLLFGSMRGTARVVPDNWNYSESNGCKGDFAVAAPGTPESAIVADLKSIRRSKDNVTKFHIHGGVDIGIAAPYNSDHQDVVNNWIDNNLTPKQILAPFDAWVVYAAKFENKKRLSGYGFYAVVVPANKSGALDIPDLSSTNGLVPVILIGHMTPSTTINLPQLHAIVDAQARIPKFHYKDVLDSVDGKGPTPLSDFESLNKLNESCSVSGKSNYYFNYDIYSRIDPSLTSERDNYMAALYKAFDQDSGSLSRRAFFVPAGHAIGCLGSSGTSTGLHYHCNYLLLRKTRKDVSNFYRGWVYDLMVTARSISNYTSFDVPVQNQQDWGVMGSKSAEAVEWLRQNVGAQDIHEALGSEAFFEQFWDSSYYGMLTGFGDTDLTFVGSTYDIPKHVLISVIESRAYQEAVNRLCNVTVDPLMLPYYDPYVMDAGMPAAIVYKNDIVLTRCTSVNVTAASTGVQTGVTFANGISVTKMLPLYLRSVKYILDRNDDDLERKNIIKNCVVYPFHSLDFYNQYAGNVKKMTDWFKDMFGRDDFVFDWRRCVSLVIDGMPNTVYNIVAGASSRLLNAAIHDSYSIERGNLIINIKDAMPGVEKNRDEALPKFERQLMLDERAWKDSYLYTLNLSKDPKYEINLKPNVRLDEKDTALTVYERDAITALEKSPPKSVVADLPGLFYDWPELFKLLRKSIKTSRPNVTK